MTSHTLVLTRCLMCSVTKRRHAVGHVMANMQAKTGRASEGLFSNGVTEDQHCGAPVCTLTRVPWLHSYSILPTQ
jgi:hypothetical protein